MFEKRVKIYKTNIHRVQCFYRMFCSIGWMYYFNISLSVDIKVHSFIEKTLLFFVQHSYNTKRWRNFTRHFLYLAWIFGKIADRKQVIRLPLHQYVSSSQKKQNKTCEPSNESWMLGKVASHMTRCVRRAAQLKGWDEGRLPSSRVSLVPRPTNPRKH